MNLELNMESKDFERRFLRRVARPSGPGCVSNKKPQDNRCNPEPSVSVLVASCRSRDPARWAGPPWQTNSSTQDTLDTRHCHLILQYRSLGAQPSTSTWTVVWVMLKRCWSSS